MHKTNDVEYIYVLGGFEREVNQDHRIVSSTLLLLPRPSCSRRVSSVNQLTCFQPQGGTLQGGRYLDDVWRMPASDTSGTFEVVKVLSGSSPFDARAFALALSYNAYIYLIGGCSGACSDAALYVALRLPLIDIRMP